MEEMKERFQNALNAILRSKREDNNFYLSRNQYESKIEQLKAAKVILKTPSSQKSQTHYRLVKRYDILTLKGSEHLIRPMVENSNTILYYATNEELFDILYMTHTEIGHGGRNRMVAALKNKYCNITKETIMIFLKVCVQCQQKSATPKKGLVSKPILHSYINCRAQLDLIDMQSRPYNDYQFILVYQDHLTKFVVLKALKSQKAVEVASHLLDIYTMFGAPAILYSDSGQEFVNSIISEIHKEWKDVKIIPRHSQSQGSVERANTGIEEMLAAWMAQNVSLDWPAALKYIQFQKNRAFHSEIGTSPYEATFGCPARVGLASNSGCLCKHNVKDHERSNLAKEEDTK